MGREDAIAALRDVMGDVGKPPTAREYRGHSAESHPSPRSIYNWYDDAERPWLTALVDALGFIDPSSDGPMIRQLVERFEQPAVRTVLEATGSNGMMSGRSDPKTGTRSRLTN